MIQQMFAESFTQTIQKTCDVVRAEADFERKFE